MVALTGEFFALAVILEHLLMLFVAFFCVVGHGRVLLTKWQTFHRGLLARAMKKVVGVKLQRPVISTTTCDDRLSFGITRWYDCGQVGRATGCSMAAAGKG